MFKIRYDRLAGFTNNLATCLSAGVDVKQAVRTSSGALIKAVPEFRAVWERVDRGDPLSEALRSVENKLPSFYIPAVQCGEQTGRLDEALRFLAEHCRLLHRPSEALRNMWLLPLAIHFGSLALACGLQLFFGTWFGMVTAADNFLVSAGSVTAVAILVLLTPMKYLIDRAKLLIPVLGSAEREIAVNRFLHVFSLLYGAGGQRVERMIRQASQSVGNYWLKEDLARAANQIEKGSTLPEAFAGTTTLTHDERCELEAGDLAGRLAETCSRVAVRAGESASAKLAVITKVVARITMFFATLSLVGTIMSLMISRIMQTMLQGY